ncbi:hypothetical protein ACHHV8_35550 [Paenibacillus sp. TAB 01]|uniref:hypothetical protein n=1 Tax=Paenibacillus sp. TAB 01 TaxID=3368988 RepID=UPI00375041D4
MRTGAASISFKVPKNQFQPAESAAASKAVFTRNVLGKPVSLQASPSDRAPAAADHRTCRSNLCCNDGDMRLSGNH